MVLTEDKQLFIFGSGFSGECGAGDQKDKLVPFKLDILKPGKLKCVDPALDYV